MTKKEQAFAVFVGALVVSAIAQRVLKLEAATLDLTALDVALIGLAIPVVLKRLT